jgi:hypothetical protein
MSICYPECHTVQFIVIKIHYTFAIRTWSYVTTRPRNTYKGAMCLSWLLILTWSWHACIVYILYFTGSIYLRLTSFTLSFDIVVLFFLYYKPPWYFSGLYSMRHKFSPVFRNMQRFISYKQQKLCGALYAPPSLNFLDIFMWCFYWFRLVIYFILFDVDYVVYIWCF